MGAQPAPGCTCTPAQHKLYSWHLQLQQQQQKQQQQQLIESSNHYNKNNTTTSTFPSLEFYRFSLSLLTNLLHICNVFANFIMFFFSYYWFYHFQKYNNIRKNQLLLGWRIHNQFSLRFDRIDNDIWCQKERFASHLHGPQKSTTKYVFLDFLEKS